VIVTHSNAAVAALQQATRTIPIVVAVMGDPVGSGFVASLARPGGNITGFSTSRKGWPGNGWSCSVKPCPRSPGWPLSRFLRPQPTAPVGQR
jgi:putative ABC transport system substrate-binding protein